MSVQAKDTKAASIHQELGEESTFSLEPPGGPNPELWNKFLFQATKFALLLFL